MVSNIQISYNRHYVKCGINQEICLINSALWTGETMMDLLIPSFLYLIFILSKDKAGADKESDVSSIFSILLNGISHFKNMLCIFNISLSTT